MKITSRRSIPFWMWKYWKQVWCLGTREMKGKGWEVSGSEDGGLRRLRFWRKGGDLGVTCLDAWWWREKKKQATEIKGPLRTKDIHKIHASLSPPKAPFIKETTLLCTEKTHANREARRALTAARTASPATAGHGHANVRHFGGNRTRQAHARSVGAKEFLVMKRN